MKNTGIQLESDYDLAVKVRRDAGGRIVSGLVVGEVTYQNQALLLMAHKGELKEKPLVGAGIGDVVNDHDFSLWKREIIEQIEGDGQRIERLKLDENGLELEARYG
jgi:hypothetical protein